MTILLVDDEESIRRVGIALLEGIGHKVLTAGDGIEALEIMREHGHEIGCVILDLTMPRLDGEATFRKLKALHPNSRVILSSGYMEREATERFSTLGLAGFLQKPYSLAELRLKLSEALGG